MKNDTRNRISDWYASAPVRCGVLLCFITNLGLTPILAFADVSLPPPAVHQTTNNGFPSSQALKNQGYDPSTGVLRVDERNRGTSTVTKTGDTITGQQQKTVTVTGNYGEKGTMSTAATQKTSVSKLGTAANTLVIGSIAGQNQSNYARQLGQDLANGDFLSAATNAMHMGGQIFDNMTGGIAGSLYDGYKGLPDLSKAADNFNKEMYGGSSSQQASQLGQAAQQAAAQQAQAERNGDLGGAIAQAAAAKAAQGAAEAAKQKDKNNEESIDKVYSIMISYFTNGSWSKPKSLGIYTDNADGRQDVIGYYNSEGKLSRHTGTIGSYDSTSIARYEYLKSLLPSTSNSPIRIYPIKITAENKNQVTAPNVNPQNLTLTASEIQQILQRMLESQQTNHKELMQQLAKIGDTVEQATTSKEYTPSVAYSDPYTPAGSDTPQQTRFEIDKNGNITTSTVSRPDLKPNSSQAPTRTVVIPNKAETGQQTGQKQTGENTTPTTGETGQQTPTTGQTGNQTPTTGQTGQTGQTNQQNQQQEFCEKNPSSAACAELGEADYEDIAIPEQTIDLKLQPMDIFSTDGTCPANPTFSIGALGTFEIPYQYLCDVARLIRPILILSTIIGCGFFAYSAVREL